MSSIRNSERKPLSFSTTMRNPNRISGFLDCILPFEGRILTSDIIHEVIKNVIRKKIYKPTYVGTVEYLNTIYKDDEQTFSDFDIEKIISNSPQQHKERGFEKGWDSRFDTWYKLPMEFGFISYEMNKPIKISNTGHRLIHAYNEASINEEEIQNIMLNALMKYQTNNPFRRNLNANAPLPLLLNVLKLLKEDSNENGAGLFRQELSILICWKDGNAHELYNYIKRLRQEVGFNYSDEYIYECCLRLLGATDSQRNRFKLSQICGEAVDEYIRKMRSTGIISLRGNGRFIDFNTLEQDKINYIIDHYSIYPIFTNTEDYYEYMGNIDNRILEIKQTVDVDLSDIKKNTLYRFASEYSKETIINELLKVCSKQESRDNVFKYISAPTRLEFLTSIALVQNFNNIDVSPNYTVDDEGLPVFTASGGMADIECKDLEYNSYFEVTLMRGRQEQIYNEVIPISRHLKEAKEKLKMDNIFSVLVAPLIHEDTKKSVSWIKFNDNLDIIAYDIQEFIEQISKKSTLSELIA